MDDPIVVTQRDTFTTINLKMENQKNTVSQPNFSQSIFVKRIILK